MPRYIDAELLESKYREGTDPQNPYSEITYLLPEDIESISTADVEPVKHGRWIIDPGCGEYGRCSECKGTSGTQWDGVVPVPLLTAYCPNCGVKMDGGESQDNDSHIKF